LLFLVRLSFRIRIGEELIDLLLSLLVIATARENHTCLFLFFTFECYVDE
jgi:hypothetical protein